MRAANPCETRLGDAHRYLTALKRILTDIIKVRYNVRYYARCHMKRVRVNEDIRPMSEFRTGIASFLKQIHDTKRPMIITQHGKGVAVLLDAGEYEAMQERIELLQDIQTSIGQIEAGQGVDNDQAKRTVLNRIRK